MNPSRSSPFGASTPSRQPSQAYDWRLLAEELGIRGRMNGEELRAGCPIHGGVDLNFSINVRTGVYMCFSNCGGGNFFQLVRRVLGIGTTAAHDWVIEHGLALNDAPLPEPEAIVSMAWKERYDRATDQSLPQWWFDRGFSWDDAWGWGIRWDGQLQQLIIPFTADGKLLGTVSRNARALPKYINSPGLPKRQTFLGWATPPPRSIFLVEGPLDAIWMRKFGWWAFPLLGLTISDEQLRLLRDVARVTVMLDNDDVGRSAMDELIERWSLHYSVARLMTVSYPEHAKDPQDCTREELEVMLQEATIGGLQ